MQGAARMLNKKLGQAVATLSKIESKDFRQMTTEEETGKFLVFHFGQGTQSDFEALQDILARAGLDRHSYWLDIYPGYPHAYLTTNSLSQAAQIREFLKAHHSQLGGPEPADPLLRKGVLWSVAGRERVVFFFNTLLTTSQLKCCSANLNLLPTAVSDASQLEKTGLFVLRDVVTETEEKALCDLLYAGKWENLSHRRVQHFGYKFLYGLNSVNPEEKSTPIPEALLKPLERPQFRQFDAVCRLDLTAFPNGLAGDYFDQVTVNEYKPGAGIPPHIDSHAPFEEALVSISLLSDIVMSLKNTATGAEVHVLLPARSALVLTGEARYLWKHSIADRKIDKLDSGLLFRKTRLSLTYRRLKKVPFCDCAFPAVCDFQREKAKPVETASAIATDAPNFESLYVKDVYNAIAEHFSHTRYKPWPLVEEFLNSLPGGSLVGDFGCGNGKYLNCGDRLQFIAADVSESFAAICRTRCPTAQVVVADAAAIPLASNSVDHAISIAVIHHFATAERRKAAIRELVRVVRPGGRVLVYVWALEQQDGRFEQQDVFVPWNNQLKFEGAAAEKVADKAPNADKKTVVYKRFYHVFRKGELEALVEEVKGEGDWHLRVARSYFDHENWCVEIEKLA